MSIQGLNLEQAYDFVKETKPNISPNFNFMAPLLEFNRQLFHESHIFFCYSTSFI